MSDNLKKKCPGCKKRRRLGCFWNNKRQVPGRRDEHGKQIYCKDCQVIKQFTGMAKKLLCEDRAYWVYTPKWFKTMKPYQLVCWRDPNGKLNVKKVELKGGNRNQHKA